MRNFRSLFLTPVKAILTSICILLCVAVIATGTIYATQLVAKKNSIGTSKAQTIALSDAGIDNTNALFEHIEFEFEDGRFVYEVQFTANGTEYEYLLKASDGSIIKKSSEKISSFLDQSNIQQKEINISNPQDSLEGQISIEEAKTIVITDASVTDATFTETKLDKDDGIYVYDIEFFTADTVYDYEINAVTGDIISKDKKIKNTPVADTQITAQQAKDIALTDANITDATFTETKLDKDDGIYVYDIEFFTADTVYDYEINAVTGDIISKEKETTKVNRGNDHIGIDAAKNIALKHTGLQVSSVRFTKVKLENDDGCTEYEIEFYINSKEYEYSIDAVTGEILDFEVDEYDD